MSATKTERLPADYRARIQIGDVCLARTENGQLWLTHRGGEGIAISKEEKLAKLLEEYFWKEF